MSYRFCPRCGTERPISDAAFCVSCGVALSDVGAQFSHAPDGKGASGEGFSDRPPVLGPPGRSSELGSNPGRKINSYNDAALSGPENVPTRNAGNGYSTASVILGSIALFLLPIILGPAAIICGTIATSRGEFKAKFAIGFSIGALIIGTVINFLVIGTVV